MIKELILSHVVTPEEYGSKILASSSGIRTFAKSGPQEFKKQFVDNLKSSSDAPYFTVGKLVELFITGKTDVIDRDYVIADFSEFASVPDGLMGTYYSVLLENTLASIRTEQTTDYEAARISNRELAYSEAGFKWSLETVEKNFSGLLERFNAELLVRASGKIVIDKNIYNTAFSAANCLTSDPTLRELVFNLSDDWVILDDVCIVLPHSKCRIDRLLINEKTKTVHIIDFKTTSKNLMLFGESIEKYGYAIQLAFYRAQLAFILEAVDDLCVLSSLVAVDTVYGDTDIFPIEPTIDNIQFVATNTMLLRTCIHKNNYSYNAIKHIFNNKSFYEQNKE